jgi:hypothetical protein
MAFGTYVWSGRASQVDFAELAVSGLASMYPASHEGDCVKLLHFDAPRTSTRAVRLTRSTKAELSSRQVFPANLTSGGTESPPRSLIRDGRAPGGRHHSLRRCEGTRPNNGDAPLDSCARAGLGLGDLGLIKMQAS